MVEGTSLMFSNVVCVDFSFQAAQVKRSKEGQVDLVSPDSILSKINCRVSKHLILNGLCQCSGSNKKALV